MVGGPDHQARELNQGHLMGSLESRVDDADRAH